ncbi:MAG: hypothetical protein ACR2KO_13255 [Geodermatophilaceae bacterium]
MTSTLARLVTEGAVPRELPMPSYLYGIIALMLFGLGLAVLWSFRGTAQKVRGSSTHGGQGHH